MSAIRPKERDAILSSLRAGVVPRAGLRLIQVGRSAEIEAQLREIDRVVDGSGSFKLVIGDYGSGKSFYLNMVRSIAHERKLVTMHADLSPQRRFSGSDGQSRLLYSELTRSMATRSRPDGDALSGVLERFVGTALETAKVEGIDAEKSVRNALAPMSEMVAGYDFATVVAAYAKGFESGNDVLMSDAMRWLRGEVATKTDARATLGVRTIVGDTNLYDFIKLIAKFCRLAGYGGLLVCFDEMVNLYKLSNRQARDTNYEEILRMLNDTLQGNVDGLGILLGGTVEFLTDQRRGLYSYAALQSRLAENSFATGGRVDFSGPVLRLASLTPEEFYVLLVKIRDVHAYGDETKHLVPNEGIQAFMSHAASRLGNTYFRTPRTTITSFINLLSVLEQNPGTTWQSLVGAVEIEQDEGAKMDAVQEIASDGEADLGEFRM